MLVVSCIDKYHLFFFFCKQKTAYEMRISDGSSDVCSSDLLVPKQFALRAPEQIAVVMATPMLWLARLTAPIVWILDGSSALIFHLLGMDRESRSQVTTAELHLFVAEASRSGVIEESERAIISGVVRLPARPAREVMTPRTDVESGTAAGGGR